MTHAADPEPDAAAAPARSVVVVGYAAFLVLGWATLLVPSLIREVQRSFAQDDAGMGVAYFMSAVLYTAGTVSTGAFAGRLPRRVLLAAGPGLLAAGFALVAATTAWPLFVVGFIAASMGNGIIDAGVNAVFMDLFAGRAAMLNRLHLFYAIGALTAPLAVGALIGAGVPWQAIVVATGAVGVVLAAAIVTRVLPPTHRDAPVARAASRAAESGLPVRVGNGGSPGRMPAGRASPAWVRSRVPLAVLALAIASYTAAEIGTSSWLVRYLADAPLQVATLALSLYWAGLGVGRLAASFVVDRVGPAAFAATSAVVFGAAILVALVAPSLPLVVACFAVAGLGAAPVIPVIMSIGGGLYPERVSTVSSTLMSAAIVGSVVYPPLMGLVSGTAGLGVGMAGAALFAFASGVGTLAAVRLARARGMEPATA